MNTTLGPTDEQVDRMRTVILAATTPRRAHRSRRVVMIGTIGVAALASAAAAALIAPATTDQRNVSVDCYTAADVHAVHATTSFVDNARDRSTLDSLNTRIARALALCEADRTAVATDPGSRTAPVNIPNPTACQLDDLRLAVFPNKDGLSAAAFCSQVGLSAPAA